MPSRKLKTHCIRGHPLSGRNLVVQNTRGTKTRKCRICRNASKARRLMPVETVEPPRDVWGELFFGSGS